MSKFIIENWSAVSAEIPDPSITVVDAKGLAEFISEALRDKSVRIKIYEVGDCIFESSK